MPQMKKLLTLTLICISLNCIAQKQTPKTEPPKQDTVLISLTDINETLVWLADNTTKTKWEQAKEFYQILYNQAAQRKSKPKK